MLLVLCIFLAFARPGGAGRAELIHDNWGVPHIFAQDRAAASYAYGWSTAEDHGELCLSLYAAARCRTAQYYGGPAGGALKVLTDQFLLSFGVRKLGERYYNTASEFSREIFDSFAAGFTGYVQQHRSRFSAEGLAVVDDPMYGGITGLDVASHSAFDLQLFVSTSVFGRLFSVLESIGDLSDTERRNASQIDPTWFVRDYLHRRDARGDFAFLKYENGDWRPAADPHAMGTLGSNAMAAVREGGGSVLHINPHLLWNVQGIPFQGFDGSAMTFYEAHMEIEGDIAAYGCSLVGVPVLNIAFTKASGWAHTVNSQTAYSLYRLTVRAVGIPPDLGRWEYLMDGEWVPFEVDRYEVESRGAETTIHNVLTSNYGPVLLLDILSNTAVVYRYAGHVFGVEQQKPLLTLEQVWRQLQATNVQEFKEAVAMQQMPMFTYIYSDHNGDMFYQSNSWTPDYTGMETPFGPYDWSIANGPPVPTETSDLRWHDIVPWLSQPQITSPAAGGVSNANDPPWYATLPAHSPDPADYRDYPWIAPFPASPDGGGSFGWRAKACLRYTLKHVDASRKRAIDAGANATAVRLAGATFEQFVDASMNVEIESAKHILDDMLGLRASALCREEPLCIAGLAVLEQWDGRCAAQSRGALLFDRFRAAYPSPGTASAWRTPFDLADPIETPRGIPGTAGAAELAIVTLVRVMREMQEDEQAFDLAWGDFKKLPVDHSGFQHGLSGSADDSVRNSHSSRRPDLGAATTTGFAGGTFKSVNEFMPGGTRWGRAGVQLAYGSQTMRGAPHNSDQWQIYSNNVYRTALLERADVEQNMERRIVLEYTWPGSK